MSSIRIDHRGHLRKDLRVLFGPVRSTEPIVRTAVIEHPPMPLGHDRARGCGGLDLGASGELDPLDLGGDRAR